MWGLLNIVLLWWLVIGEQGFIPGITAGTMCNPSF